MTTLEALARTDEVIDLSDIRRKLADPEEGKGLVTEQLVPPACLWRPLVATG